MDRQQVQVSAQQYIERMQGDFERTMYEIADAVNRAPDGQWINGSEVQVLETMTEFRRKAYETALQMRVDAAEGTFSPDGPGNLEKTTKQGPGSALDPKRQRAGVAATAALPFSGPGHQHTQR